MRRVRPWIALLVALELASVPAWAAVTANSLVSPQTPNRGIAQVLNATGAILIAANNASVANSVVAYTCATTAGAATKINAMWAGSTDTVARDVQILLVNTSKVYVIATVTVAIGAGTVAGTPMVNLLSAANAPGLPVDSDGNPYLTCVSGDTIVVGTLVAPTANKAITVITNAADF